jgi:deoxyribose-phosphate aldolase
MMKDVVGDELEVKASGGVRTASDVDTMIDAGATRIGASASIAIVQGNSQKKGRGGSSAAAKGGY